MIDIRPEGLMTHHEILDRKTIETEAELKVSTMSLDELIIYINELQKLQTHARFVELVATKRKHKVIAELPSDDPRITKVAFGESGRAERTPKPKTDPAVKAIEKLNAMLEMMENLQGRKFTDEERENFFKTNG